MQFHGLSVIEFLYDDVLVIKLSFCSKKISTQINIARLYSQKVIVSLDMLYLGIRVHSENNKDTFGILIRFNNGTINNLNIQQYRIEGYTVPVIFCTKGINLFWENHREGFLSVIRCLLKIFRCKFSINNDYNGDSYQPIISKLFDLQLEFKMFTIRPNGSTDQNSSWNQISSNFGLVEDLRISSSFKPSFRPVFTSWPQKITIMNSYWFTVEYLLTCNCTTITLGGSHLENKNLDVIFLKWKAGGFPNLEYLYVESQSIKNNGTTVLGMNLPELDGKVIQTDDGSKKATIHTDYGRYGRIELSVTPF
ncbi:hypothetical protein GCK72_003134 [Caenorhabditis remanei]|uniref:Sdz-33 F-box domain-containing protein n=1 Tax=Caenorhabditis remanei TaxID=31234 RepID=A0A6A5HTN2_CAERE|nr:hypothetical protein GCK72_003134 [Caenorhabditis remanei]KAF1771308.1 hypothetical protein GCK72_003134 [Caenorhabditis remanei]